MTPFCSEVAKVFTFCDYGNKMENRYTIITRNYSIDSFSHVNYQVNNAFVIILPLFIELNQDCSSI